MQDLETRVAALEKENAELKEVFNSLYFRMDELIKFAQRSLTTEIKTLEEAYDYEAKVRGLFNKISN